MMGHGPAYPFVTTVLLYVCYPLLTLSHDLHSFQVEVFVDDLQENIPNVIWMEEPHILTIPNLPELCGSNLI